MALSLFRGVIVLFAFLPALALAQGEADWMRANSVSAILAEA